MPPESSARSRAAPPECSAIPSVSPRAPDGGYLVTEAGSYAENDPEHNGDVLGPRVLRVRPGGTIETVARGLALDVVVLADGTAVLAGYTGRLWRLEPGSRTPRPYLRPARPTDTFDFAARSRFGWSLALDRSGGLLVGGRSVLTFVPHGQTPWTLAALRGTRTSRRAVTAVIETTQPGMATLEIAQPDRIIARVTKPVAAGHSTLRAFGPIGTDWYDVRLRLEGPNGATAHDEVAIHGARALTVRLARRLLGRNQGHASDEDIYYRLGRDCRRFGRRRVDCVITQTDDVGKRSNVGVASVTLERTGILLRRHYPWGRRGFQRHPRFIADDGVQPLSRHHGGKWASGP
jgi:hypothetical protein